MTITVVIKMIQDWLLIDLCFLVVFQDETVTSLHKIFRTVRSCPFISFNCHGAESFSLEGRIFKSRQFDLNFILAQCGTESEVNLLSNTPLPFPPTPFSLPLSLPYFPFPSPQFLLLKMKKACEQRQCHQKNRN